MRRTAIFATAALVSAGLAYGLVSVTDPGGRGPAGAQECKTIPDAVVLVHLDRSRWPNLTEHVLSAQGHEPRHLHIDRPDADAHRAASLAGIPTKTGFDRDEYPPAMSAEGGAGADVAYVPSSENRSQGSVMGQELSAYCDGQGFELVSP